MKKQIIISGAIACLISLSSLATIVAKNTNADSHATSKTSNSLIAFDNSLGVSTTPKLNSSDETVYIITDAEGKANKSFIGSTINTSSESLPVELHINYTLDGQPITATELSGKSGHIHMNFTFTPAKTYQNKFVPFISVTGLTLDNNRFSNLSFKNAKIISEGKKTIIAGYSFIGLNENLGTDFLPNSFEIEADTTNFKLDNTYTLITNEIFADLDTSKLASVDGIISSINDLSTGFSQIIAGASRLDQGAAELAAGLGQVVALHNQILTKANEVVTTVTDIATEIIEEYDLDPELVAKLTAPIKKYYDEAYTAITTYTEGIKKLSDGANQLHSGTTELKNGLSTFKSRGIDKLVNFANHDLNSFVINARKTVEAAGSYRSYNNPDAKSVKFIFKTPSI